MADPNDQEMMEDVSLDADPQAQAQAGPSRLNGHTSQIQMQAEGGDGEGYVEPGENGESKQRQEVEGYQLPEEEGQVQGNVNVNGNGNGSTTEKPSINGDIKETPLPPLPSTETPSESSPSYAQSPPPDAHHPSHSQSISSLPSTSTPSLHHPQNSIYRSSTPASASGSLTSLSGIPHLSLSMITPTLNLLATSKESKRSPALLSASKKALESCQAGSESPADPRVVLEPLKLACELGGAEKLVGSAVDLIGKLVSHGFFTDEADAEAGHGHGHEGPPLADLITHIITSAYTESSSPIVSLQVVKSLLSIVLSTTLNVHQSSLLKAVRTVYNVYLLSGDATTQLVAQGSLTQMIHHIFGRVKRTRVGGQREREVGGGGSAPSTPTKGGFAVSGRSTPVPRLGSAVGRKGEEDGTAETPGVESEAGPSGMTLESFSQPNPNDQIPLDPDTTADLPSSPRLTQSQSQSQNSDHDPNGTHGGLPEASQDLDPDTQVHVRDPEFGRVLSLNQLFVKDAFLVFRALCKLTMKPLLSESEKDPRSHDMRSKLLSLHLVLAILQSHSDLFADPYLLVPSSSSSEDTPFLQATKQYLCLGLSRNALSSVNHVFDLSAEIFWCMLKYLRAQLKKEIEVLFNEIYIPVLEMKHATLKQKSVLLNNYIRLWQDPQALVDIYINYDCDRSSVENIYERLVNIVARLGQAHFPLQSKAEETASDSKVAIAMAAQGASLTSISAIGDSKLSSKYNGLGAEQRIRRQALDSVLAILQALVEWINIMKPQAEGEPVSNASEAASRRSQTEHRMSMTSANGDVTPDLVRDDPERFESVRQHKTSLLEGIRDFNYEPKRGIAYFLKNGFIKSENPKEIATFLLHTEGLSKAQLGEYLGDAKELNIAVMHAFVDSMDFASLNFVDAVRQYLQSFRLPGEAQKIDRFMLKFAERYIADNTSTPFANADTAYVLAFSVIMLNTDAHNKNLKQKRMSKAEFVKNNRGINDGQDLPEELLSEVYDEIQNNEIKMRDEVELAPTPQPTGLASTLANVGRDLQREAYVLQSEGIVNKTEAMFKTLVKQQRRAGKDGDLFFSASHLEHVRPMFEVAWMPFLAALSAPMQESEDMNVILLCLDGFKAAIKVAGFFDMDLERNAFVSTLAKFTLLDNLAEMRAKHVEAIKTLLDIAISDGDHLRTSWREVLTCVSQLERMQLISSGIDVPELYRRTSTANSNSKSGAGRRKGPAGDVAEEGRSTQVTVAADMVFSLSRRLSGTAIVDFVRALSEVSWEEIQSSSSAAQPRLFSLQKLVDIAYYNMDRIRLEWSNIWAILGNHFNQVCCHNNPNVSFFALDALRQLSMRFLEKEELAHFRFQKDFLKPFEHTMAVNQNSDAREMVLQCLQQMLQARVNNLRSGWQTMFRVYSAASRVLTERVVTYAFELVNTIYREHFELVLRFGSISELTQCLTDFSKVTKFQKVSLQAIQMVQGLIPKVLKESPARISGDDAQEVSESEDPTPQYWLPVLLSFYDIIMTGEDLEVRRMALDSLFGTLKTHGANFKIEFWKRVCDEVLFPIFGVLKSAQEVSRFSSQEEMSVWLSTTLISALRSLISLFTVYFETLQEFLPGLLDLLCACICQENDTLARIGTACFQQLLEENVKKLSPEKWESIVGAFVQLFQTTTAHQLFDENLRSENTLPEGSDIDEQKSLTTFTPIPTKLGPLTASVRRRIFKQIIVKCVLQLLLIETTHELLENDNVYNTIPAIHLLRFMTALDDSYEFARKFNADKDLRMALWKVGFMKQLPNLLKQESTSAATLVNVLLKMYRDPRPDHQASRQDVLEQFIPLGVRIIKDFNAIDPEAQPRNIVAWTPVVTEILQGTYDFEAESFERYLPQLYPLVTRLLEREMAPDLWQAVRVFYVRTGEVKGLMGKET